MGRTGTAHRKEATARSKCFTVAPCLRICEETHRSSRHPATAPACVKAAYGQLQQAAPTHGLGRGRLRAVVASEASGLHTKPAWMNRQDEHQRVDMGRTFSAHGMQGQASAKSGRRLEQRSPWIRAPAVSPERLHNNTPCHRARKTHPGSGRPCRRRPVVFVRSQDI